MGFLRPAGGACVFHSSRKKPVFQGRMQGARTAEEKGVWYEGGSMGVGGTPRGAECRLGEGLLQEAETLSSGNHDRSLQVAWTLPHFSHLGPSPKDA